MAELIIIIGQNKVGVLDGLKMKSTLERSGIEVMGVLTKKTQGEKVPKELIESILKVKMVEYTELKE